MQTSTYIKPRQLAAAIGVSESSLKRWTDRGLLPTVKTAGGHRRLPLWGVVEYLRKTGHPIVRPELLGLPAPVTEKLSSKLGGCCGLLFDALLFGRPDEAISMVTRAFMSGHSPADICDDLIRPVLERIGAAWERGEIDIYHEHRAVQIVRRALFQLRELQRPGSIAECAAVGASPESDPYCLASAMVECVLAGLGWQTTDLGADIPFSSLARAAGELKPRLIWLSISTPVNPDTFIPAYSDFQRTADAAGASIVIGGRGVTAELRSELAYASFGERMRHLVGFAECVSRPARNAPMNDAL